jgi:hypothetical protein
MLFENSGLGWIVLRVIEWWSFKSKVTCQPFDHSDEAFRMEITYNVIIKRYDVFYIEGAEIKGIR